MQLLEDYEPAVKQFGLNTNKNVTFGGTTTINGPAVVNNVLTFGGIVQGTIQALATTTPLTVTPTSTFMTLTPTQSQTLNFAAPVGAGLYLVLEIVTSGTSSFTITFGTNTKTTGTLATGTTSGKYFVVCLTSDATNWVEQSRTTAM